ncbi:MAG: histidine kinase [Crocinitomicaceae bacterium]
MSLTNESFHTPHQLLRKISPFHMLTLILFFSVLTVDYFTSLGASIWVFYVMIMIIALWHKQTKTLIWITIISAILIIVGFYISEHNYENSIPDFNRFYGALTIAIVGIALYYYQQSKYRSHLERNEKRYMANLIASFKHSIAIIDRYGVIIDTNEEWKNLGLESADDELLGSCKGTNFRKLCHQFTRNKERRLQLLAEKLLPVLKGDHAEKEIEYQSNNHEWYKISLTPVKETNGAVLIYCTNITDEKNMINHTLKAKGQLLSTQLNPHFIFNSLNSIQYFILGQKTETAIEYLSSFAGLMRKTLDNSMHSFIPISEDMKFLEQYVNLEVQRTQNPIEFSISVNETLWAEELLIPPMLIQPFVENAIIHGLSAKKSDRKLNILFSENTNDIICTIDDNGIGRNAISEKKNSEKENHVSHGMQLINSKINILNQLFHDGFSVRTIDKTTPDYKSEGTRIELTFPKVWAEDDLH